MDAEAGKDMISLFLIMIATGRPDNDDKMYSKSNKNSKSIGHLKKKALHPTVDDRL